MNLGTYSFLRTNPLQPLAVPPNTHTAYKTDSLVSGRSPVLRVRDPITNKLKPFLGNNSRRVNPDDYTPPGSCPPRTKPSVNSSNCVSLQNLDVFHAIRALTSPPKAKCKSIQTVQGISVCEDMLPKKKCHILSVITTDLCNDMGSLEFEKYWSTRCEVIIVHFYFSKTDKMCIAKSRDSNYKSIQYYRYGIWNKRCYACLNFARIDMSIKYNVLKIQQYGNNTAFFDEMDGVQYKILSDFYLHHLVPGGSFDQILFRVSLTPKTLTDFVGRVEENLWMMWASQQFLLNYGVFSTSIDSGNEPFLSLQQYNHALTMFGVDPNINYYSHSFLKIRSNSVSRAQMGGTDMTKRSAEEMFQQRSSAIHGEAPQYCSIPLDGKAKLHMEKWIETEMKVRCHPTRMWVTCDR